MGHRNYRALALTARTPLPPVGHLPRVAHPLCRRRTAPIMLSSSARRVCASRRAALLEPVAISDKARAMTTWRPSTHRVLVAATALQLSTFVSAPLLSADKAHVITHCQRVMSRRPTQTRSARRSDRTRRPLAGERPSHSSASALKSDGAPECDVAASCWWPAFARTLNGGGGGDGGQLVGKLSESAFRAAPVSRLICKFEARGAMAQCGAGAARRVLFCERRSGCGLMNK